MGAKIKAENQATNGNGWKSLLTKRDCRHFLDYKPCKMHKKFGVTCETCPYYEQKGKKILIINLEAIGDVLRTTSLLIPLKKKYPACQLTWVTTEKARDILKNNPHIDRILSIGYETTLQLMIEEFDIMMNFDKAHEAAAIAKLVKAKEKKGFVLGNDGMIDALDDASKYFFDIGFSDKAKRASKKTQQEIVFNIAGIPYNHDKTILNLTAESIQFAENFMQKHGIDKGDFVVGFNTGCSNRLFVDRKWTANGYIELAPMLHKVLGAKIVLLGGPNEIDRNNEIMEKAKAPIINSGNSNTLDQFCSIISKCSMIVTGDTLAVHIAAALGIPTVAIFGNVSLAEIELYGIGKKVQTDMDCWGCYKYECEFKKTCMDRISAARVFEAIKELIKEKGLLENKIMSGTSELNAGKGRGG